MRNIIYLKSLFIKRIIEVFISCFIWCLKSFYSPDNSLWLFSERNGENFSGNSKALFEYILKNEKKVNAYWITRSSVVFSTLKTKNIPVVSYYSFKAIKFILKTKIFVVTHGSLDIGRIQRKNRLVINLWHGVLVKPHVQIYNEIQKNERGLLNFYKDKFMIFLRFGKAVHDYDLVISPSFLVKEKMVEQFPYSKKVVVTGTPTDNVFFTHKSKELLLKKYKLEHLTGKTIVAYLPTYRDNPIDNKLLFENKRNIEILTNAVVLLKYHPNCQPFINIHSLPKNVIYFENLKIDDKDLYEISDILITDYSSSFINFLPFNKPMIFYTYDFDNYMKTRGFLYDYLQVTPGTKVNTEEELVVELELLIAGKDDFIEERKEKINLFYQYKDGKSSKRVFDEIQKLID